MCPVAPSLPEGPVCPVAPSLPEAPVCPVAPSLPEEPVGPTPPTRASSLKTLNHPAVEEVLIPKEAVVGKIPVNPPFLRTS